EGGGAEGDLAALGEQAHRAGVVAVVNGVQDPLAVDVHRQLGSVDCHFEVIGLSGVRARKWSGGECVAAGQVVEPYAGTARVEGDRVSGRAVQGRPEHQRAHRSGGLGCDAGRIHAIGRELLLGQGEGGPATASGRLLAAVGGAGPGAGDRDGVGNRGGGGGRSGGARGGLCCGEDASERQQGGGGSSGEQEGTAGHAHGGSWGRTGKGGPRPGGGVHPAGRGGA